MIKHWLSGVALVAALAFSGAASAQIKMGVAGPITGPNAAFGAQLVNGTQQAVDDINKDDSVAGVVEELRNEAAANVAAAKVDCRANHGEGVGGGGKRVQWKENVLIVRVSSKQAGRGPAVTYSTETGCLCVVSAVALW